MSKDKLHMKDLTFEALQEVNIDSDTNTLQKGQ
jgi:hypothetical protein